MKKIIGLLLMSFIGFSSFGQVSIGDFSSVTTPKIRIKDHTLLGDLTNILHSRNGHLYWGGIRTRLIRLLTI